MTVVVIGDANVDLEVELPVGGEGVEYSHPPPRLFGGGSAANTAAALARLDVASRFVGAVGDDGYGRFVVEGLDGLGVDVSLVTVTEQAPTAMVIVIVPNDGERLIYVWPPIGGAHAHLETSITCTSVADAAWVHVSGISLRVSPARQAILAAMDAARAEGIPVSLDLNLRLENWGWAEGFRDVIESAVDRADYVLGGALDEVGPLARSSDPEEAARAIATDERTVVARMGGRGALAVGGGSVVVVPAFAVDVVDTVGAGDAFNAGFIEACLRSSPLPEALVRASAVAALTITGEGARSHPTAADVEQFLTHSAG